MKYQLENCFINIRSNSEYLTTIQNSLSGNNKITFFYLNSYSFYLAHKSTVFRDALNKSNFIIADGYSIVWLIRRVYKINIEKVVFTYFFFDKLANLFSEGNTRIYLLGSSQEVIEKSAELLIKKYKLNIVGFSNGFFEIDVGSKKIIEEINSTLPDVIIVGMGMPKSEVWIQNNLNQLNARVIFSVGGFFDFLTGKNKIAPKWLYNSGLEWIHRLIQEPRRLFKRYLIANSYLIYSSIKLILVNEKKD